MVNRACYRLDDFCCGKVRPVFLDVVPVGPYFLASDRKKMYNMFFDVVKLLSYYELGGGTIVYMSNVAVSFSFVIMCLMKFQTG